MFAVSATGPTMLLFSWAPLDESLQNGMILNYSVICTPAPTHGSLLFDDEDKKTYSEEVDGFTPATQYTCTIRAVSLDGLGPPATSQVTTPESSMFTCDS